MRIRKWISQEVEVEVCAEDIHAALSEGPTANHDVLRVLNSLGAILRAISDEQIASMTQGARGVVLKFLADQAERYKLLPAAGAAATDAAANKNLSPGVTP